MDCVHRGQWNAVRGGFASKKKGVQGEHSPRAASTGLIGAGGKRETEGGTVGSFLEGAGSAAPPLVEAKPCGGRFIAACRRAHLRRDSALRQAQGERQEAFL